MTTDVLTVLRVIYSEVGEQLAPEYNLTIAILIVSWIYSGRIDTNLVASVSTWASNHFRYRLLGLINLWPTHQAADYQQVVERKMGEIRIWHAQVTL